MQVDALLSETSPLPEEVAVFEEVVERLKQALQQLKSVQVRSCQCHLTPGLVPNTQYCHSM